MKRQMKFEFLTLELIDKRRAAEHRPSIGRDVERRIIERHLRELEDLAGTEWLKVQRSEN